MTINVKYKYEFWEDYLSRGRNKNERPVFRRTYFRVKKHSGPNYDYISFVFRWSKHTVVTYRKSVKTGKVDWAVMCPPDCRWRMQWAYKAMELVTGLRVSYDNVTNQHIFFQNEGDWESVFAEKLTTMKRELDAYRIGHTDVFSIYDRASIIWPHLDELNMVMFQRRYIADGTVWIEEKTGKVLYDDRHWQQYLDIRRMRLDRWSLGKIDRRYLKTNVWDIATQVDTGSPLSAEVKRVNKSMRLEARDNGGIWMNPDFAKSYRDAVDDIMKYQKILQKVTKEREELEDRIKIWESLHGKPTLNSEAYDVGTRVKSI